MLLLLAALAHAEPVTGYVDLHIHLGAHLAVPFYGDGPDAPLPPHPSNRHSLTQQISADDLAGPSILVSLAYANPALTVFETQRSMRARIDRQLDFVEGFSVRHADRFGLARSPEEARQIIASGRIAVVLGIEGATKLLGEPGDAARWSARGVSVVTPIHLADNEIGGSLCMSGALALMNLPGCVGQRRHMEREGLTERGFASVNSLIDAGVVIDIAHTSPTSFDDLIGLLTERHVAPVYTHAVARTINGDRAAVSDAMIEAIYGLGGLIGITANLHSVAPDPVPADAPADRCPGSIDDLRSHWDHLTAIAAGAPVAWGSDFQGGISHIRPKYGPKGCAETRPDGAPLDAFDVEGLSRPGLVEPMFQHLAAEGANLAPLHASAERFLQIWAQSRAAAGLHDGAKGPG